MPDNNNGSGDHVENKGQSTGYSADYVKELRDENAGWRTKLRDTEAKLNELSTKIKNQELSNTVGKELEKRGVKADPTWIKMTEGETPEQAVDKFLKDYPQLVQQTEDTFVPNPKRVPKPMEPNSHNTNVENTAKSELDAIKQDPIARAKLRGLYRDLLAKNAGVSTYIQS